VKGFVIETTITVLALNSCRGPITHLKQEHDTQIKTSKENKEVVSLLTKLGLGTENVIARIAFYIFYPR
jgi:hypothetical protein